MREQDEASDASSAGTASPAASLLAADTAGEARTAGNLRAVAAACIAGIGPFIFGYTLGFTSPAQLPMEVGASGPFGAVLESHLDADGAVASSQAALFGSIVNVGAMLGALVAGPLADSIGRRLTIAAAALPWILAWSAIAFGRTFAEVLADRRTEGKGETLERHTQRERHCTRRSGRQPGLDPRAADVSSQLAAVNRCSPAGCCLALRSASPRWRCTLHLRDGSHLHPLLTPPPT